LIRISNAQGGAPPAPGEVDAPTAPPPGPGARLLARVDAFFDRIYGWRFNPLYQSGTIAVLLLGVLVVTGVYLLLFYRIGAPHASVERIQAQWWGGRWIRSLHRFASDAALVAVAIHALRMFLRRRSWGPRALAWVSGVGLTGLFLLVAVTGFVMVWDDFGRLLAMEGARILDALPIFTEPLVRAFTGERPMPGAFFFLNYFLHIAVPLGMALFLYLHVSRLARPNLLPGRGLAWGIVGGLTLLAIAFPVALHPPADPSVVLDRVPGNLFFGFWLPLTQALPAAAVWGVGGALLLILVTVPLWSKPRAASRPGISAVEERHCTGCTQCSLDCPYEAIAMVARTDGRLGLVAQVDPALCVSCGICAGSCAPMSVGPPERTGRDQLDRVRGFLAQATPGARDVVLVACSRGAGELQDMTRFEGARVYPVDCVGSLHSSVVEFLVRGGAGGVLVAGCPDRDCWNREGTRWTRERLFHEREAELKPRVDRKRVALVTAGAGERAALAAEVRRFQAQVAALIPPEPEVDPAIDLECDRPEGVPAPVGAEGTP
jgi:coenzyme F420-reducing hydrogenase delta subunit/Pyruvate/2-oxoacid:ferredoxin oxidoreductase delta subunit